MALFPSTSIASAAGGYDIDNSCRFNSPDTAILYRVPSTTGNQKTYTISFWWKFGGLVNAGGSQNYIITSWHTSGTGGGRYWVLRIQTNQIRFSTGDASDLTDPSPTAMELRTNRLFRDVSSWYHICLSVDTTQATASNRGKLYINGVQETSFQTANYGSQNDIHFINHTNTTMQVGGINASGWSPTANYCADGYIAEYHQIDGTALTPTSFGVVDADYGHWKPKKYSGGHGTNGYHLDFQSSGSLGNDAAGSNNLSSTGLVVSDQMLDSPTNNFQTANSLDRAGGSYVFKQGNLHVTRTGGDGFIGGTMGVNSGKWYFELFIQSGLSWYPQVGIWDRDNGNDVQAIHHPNEVSGASASRTWGANGSRNGPGMTGSAPTYTNGDILQFAMDLDNQKLHWGKNNVWYSTGTTVVTSAAIANNTAAGTFTDITAGSYWEPCIFSNNNADNWFLNCGQDATFAGTKSPASAGPYDDGDYGSFYYQPPSGFKAICTKNLSEPAVKPGEHFNTILYDDGAGAKTGVGFQPDMVWVKSRGSAYNHKLTDAVRGVTKALSSNLGDSAAEVTDSTGLTAFGADGFTVGSDTNYSDTTGDGMVAWCWKANGSGSSNTDGSINTTATSANTAAGFSISTYAGNGVPGATVGHGLSVTPNLVIIREVNHTGAWQVGSLQPLASMDFTDDMNLHNTIALEDYLDLWNDTAPTSTLVTLGNSEYNNYTGRTYVMYCFHNVGGHSKIGSYKGNGNDNGTFIYTGFRPKFILCKVTSTTDGWQMMDTARDPYNVASKRLEANREFVEATASWTYVDFLSNGFKPRGTDTIWNNASHTYLYMAFAEYPFKYTTAR